MSGATVGLPCPPFAATAAVSGRSVTPQALSGHQAVLVCHGPKSTDAPKDVARAVRSKSLDPKAPVLASIVDLRPMAGLWRKVAEAQIKSSYAKLAEKVPPGHDPADHILICPDWDAAACLALGATQADQEPLAIVLDEAGTVSHVLRGPGLGNQVVAALGL